jgi:hypothetical protein
MLRFPDRPATTLPELQRNVLELFYQFGAGAEGRLHRDVAISSAGTQFAHGLRGVPQSCLIVPKQETEGPPYLDPDNLPDERLLYLKAVPTKVFTLLAGRNGVGATSVPEAQVGDVLFYAEIPLALASFEAVVTVNAQVQQTDPTDLSGDVGMLILKRPVSINCDLLVLP